MKQQKGFVLVSVLIITSITTMLAFSQLSENRLQERIAGNQQKEIKARLAAEKGMFDAFDFIVEKNADGTSNVDIADALKDKTGEYYSFPFLNLEDDGITFTLTSQGSYHNAVSYLKTSIEVGTESETFFGTAVVGCDGVTAEGAAKIDSYKGQSYATATPGINGDVKVISGVVALGNGNGSNKGIDGFVTANSITGNKALIAERGVDANGEPVAKYLEDYTGDPKDCDPLHMVAYTDDDGVQQKGEISKIKEKLGLEYIPGDYVTGAYTDFDLDVGAAGGVSPQELTILGEKKQGYVFNNFDTGQGKQKQVLITGDIIFYIQGNMTIKQTTFTLANDTSSLTIYIDGKMSVATGSEVFSDQSVTDDNVPLTVYSSYGSSDSSTSTSSEPLITESTVVTNSNSKGEVTTYTSVTTTATTETTYIKTTAIKNGKTTVDESTDTVCLSDCSDSTDSTDSTDTDGLAVTLQGNANVYMNLYAPSGNVAYVGNGDIMGALRGKTVDVGGSGGIHYDEGLVNIVSNGSGEVKTSYSSVYYYYPDE